MKSRILVVDDDITLALVASEILELAGYEVRVHHSPFGTTAAMNEFRPDVVLLDVNMPALSGDKLVPLLRAARDAQPARIVFFSSNDEDTLRTQVRTTGADGFIRKGDIDRLGRHVAAYATP